MNHRLIRSTSLALLCVATLPVEGIAQEEEMAPNFAALDALLDHDYAGARRALQGHENSTSAIDRVVLGILDRYGLGGRQDLAAAARHLAAASDARCALAAVQLAELARGHSQLPAAAGHERHAALLGDAGAMLRTAWAYRLGRGVQQDLLQASAWMILAAENGVERARDSIERVTAEARQGGSDLDRLQGSVENLKQQMESIRNQGVTQLQIPIHEFVQQLRAPGDRAWNDQDWRKAGQVFLPLAQAGDAVAQFYAGRMFEMGYGVDADPREAIRWYTHSSQAGIGASADNLALMYARGAGVEQDMRAALDLFLIAAADGNADACLNLGYCHGTGRGVKPDMLSAWTWYTVAARAGDQTAADNLRAVQGELSADQRAHAERVADQLTQQIRAGQFESASTPAVPMADFLQPAGGAPAGRGGVLGGLLGARH